jgi:UDPglucose--hexose-1-phosphate uridylyltransferase
VIAAGRARRPGAFFGAIEEPSGDERETCPFCDGREALTPPEVLALGRSDGEPDTPGWTVRVVPNLYPALERQEVVVHSPRHVRSFAELHDEEVGLVAEAWHQRDAAARAEGFPYTHAMVNEGRFAGASLAHSHSQLVWLREPPPAVTAEGENLRDLLRLEVDRHDGLVLACHPAGRVPYEMLVASPEGGFDLEAALKLVREAIRRLRAVEGAVPWNAWLHVSASTHLEIVPRLTVLAGLELGAGIYVNVVSPEEAAAALRAV